MPIQGSETFSGVRTTFWAGRIQRPTARRLCSSGHSLSALSAAVPAQPRFHLAQQAGLSAKFLNRPGTRPKYNVRSLLGRRW